MAEFELQTLAIPLHNEFLNEAFDNKWPAPYELGGKPSFSIVTTQITKYKN